METRTCRVCHEEKPINKFDKVSNNTYGGYRRKICRQCWWASRSEEQREAKREIKRRSEQKLRSETFEAYGNKCTCCGESEPAFLVIDHIGDNGADHRREMRPTAPKTWAGKAIYSWLRQNNWPEGFQILCANCNMAKARKEGCPHAITP